MRQSEESSENANKHDARHNIYETADHIEKKIYLTFLDAFG